MCWALLERGRVTSANKGKPCHTAQAIPGVPPLPERAAEAGAGAEEDEDEGGAGRARRPAANPATWVLDISRPAAEQRLGVDFAAVYAASALAQCAPGWLGSRSSLSRMIR